MQGRNPGYSKYAIFNYTINQAHYILDQSFFMILILSVYWL